MKSDWGYWNYSLWRKVHFYSKVIVSLFLSRKHQAWAGIYLNWYWEKKVEDKDVSASDEKLHCSYWKTSTITSKAGTVWRNETILFIFHTCWMEMKNILRWDKIRHHNAFVSCYMLINKKVKSVHICHIFHSNSEHFKLLVFWKPLNDEETYNNQY